MTCANCRERWPLRIYRYAMGRRVTALCNRCAAALIALGMDLR